MMFLVGVIFFCLLCRRVFKSWMLAVMGSLFLVLQPRIFAHSFYNSIDNFRNPFYPATYQFENEVFSLAYGREKYLVMYRLR